MAKYDNSIQWLVTLIDLLKTHLLLAKQQHYQK